MFSRFFLNRPRRRAGPPSRFCRALHVAGCLGYRRPEAMPVTVDHWLCLGAVQRPAGWPTTGCAWQRRRWRPIASASRRCARSCTSAAQAGLSMLGSAQAGRSISFAYGEIRQSLNSNAMLRGLPMAELNLTYTSIIERCSTQATWRIGTSGHRAVGHSARPKAGTLLSARGGIRPSKNSPHSHALKVRK